MCDDPDDRFSALLLRFELGVRRLVGAKDSVTDEALAIHQLTKIEAELRKLLRDSEEGLKQVHDAYQDIAKTYFDFIEKIEIALSIPSNKEVDVAKILEAIEALKIKVGATPPGPTVLAYQATVSDDPHFLLAMRPGDRGQWVKKSDYLYAVSRIHEGAKVALEYREQEIVRLKAENAVLKAAGAKVAALVPVEGSRERHQCHRDFVRLLDELQGIQVLTSNPKAKDDVPDQARPR